MNTSERSSPLRIFLVEDNEHDRLVFRRALQKSGIHYEIAECVWAEEALERLRAEASLFDLAVVDHHLPGMTGVDLCRELLHEEIPLPTVFLTGSGSEQIAVDALKTGAYDYIIKDPGQGYLDLLPVVLPAVTQKHGERLARKKAEEALQKAHDELEMRVEQRTAELRESELKYRLLIDNYNAPITVLDLGGTTLVMNHAAARGLGGRPEDFIGKNLDEYFPNGAYIKELNSNIIATEEGGEFEHEIKLPSGKRWYWSNIQPIKDLNGAVYAVQIISYDVTERKRAEEALRSERNKFRSVINAIGEDVFIVNSDYTIEYLSDGFGDTSGNGKGEKCHSALFHLNEPCKFCAMKKTLETGEVQDIEVIFPDGRHGNLIFSPFTDVDSNDKVIVLSRDITEKKTIESEAMRAGHLASLGELAAGVAHEINNPVTGIIACSEILKSRCQAQGEDDEIPNRIIKEGVRIAKIVKNLLSFAQDRKEELGLVQVKDIVKDALNLVERQIVKDGTKINVNFPPDLPMIKARTHRVQQVFLNILSNSRYALNKRFPGTHKDKLIEIRGETVEIEGREHVRTTFFDKGTGMPPDILDKIIGPFFSTKPQGEGTGLGLSISHGIIKAHGGRLWFESAEGEYTKAMVDIPADNGR